MRARDRILVTGGCGYVGSHFARAAHDAGSKVIVLDDFSAGTQPKLPTDVEIVRGDIADRTLVPRLLRDQRITAIAHFAGKIQVGESVQKPRLYFDGNLVKSLALLDSVLDSEVRTFLFSSTAAVYGMPDEVPIPETARTQPINPYGASKLALEHALDAYGVAHGLRWAALRYFNAAGAHSDGSLREGHEPETHLLPLVIDAALGRRPPLTVFGTDYPTADGTCIRDYVHVEDLASAHLAALDALDAGKPVAATNLGSASGFSVREVLDTAARVLGKPVPHTFGARRPGDPAVLLASNARAKEVLGWRPVRSDLATIIEDAARARM
ncbi:MAG: UDP-glucose 4-epimerase GalE [Deltaproteobacteria bacterium]|nr:UDP-glucose 4-epimerase GalE [Deltaproteobacteria bacterium]